MFTLPLLIPLLILGFLSIYIVQQYVKNEINKNNIILLNQIAQNIDVMLDDMDSLTISFNHDYSMVTRLRRIFEQRSESLSDIVTLDMVNSILKAPANSKPYIHSIYVFYENENHYFISTKDGLTSLENCSDISWYNSFISDKTHKTTWIEYRKIRDYAFETTPFGVVTIYGKLYSSSSLRPAGVIVLNINPNSIESTLKKLVTYPGQEILIMDENNRIIFSNISPNIKSHDDLEKISSNSDTSFTASIGGESCVIAKLDFSRLGLKYISIVRQNVLYNIPIQLIILTSCLLIISFALGLVLTYYFTQKNYKQVLNIISILNSAEKGELLPSLPDRITNEYSYIIHNILKTFIEQSYLKLQLSEKQYKMQAMQLMALQSQINPHFLYNTMHAIYWEAFSFTRGQNKLTSMVDNLTQILRYSLEDPSQKVRLEDEIKNAAAYIKIQQLRFKDRFEVIWSYDEALIDFYIIKLILQPLIENCIYHGFKDAEGKCHIKIKINRKDSRMKITVIDNGSGISKQKLEEIRANMESEGSYMDHIGLNNTNRRLTLMYGDDSGLKLRSKPGLGTAIYISIPLERQLT